MGNSVTRLGDFYKFLATNCLTKVAQTFWWLFWGLFLKMSFLFKKCVATFRQYLWEIRQLFIPSSGHTGGKLGANVINQSGHTAWVKRQKLWKTASTENIESSKLKILLNVSFIIAQSRPLFVYFRLFHKTQLMCLGLEPGSACGRRRRIHWAMCGTPKFY